MGDATQTYALYVPSGYSSARRWSVLLAFDPAARGRVMVEKYRAAAEQYDGLSLELRLTLSG